MTESKGRLIATFVAVLAALALALPASAGAPRHWLLTPNQPSLIIFRGWPVTWDVVRAPGEVRIHCWGGKHTRVRGDLTSTLTLKNLRTGELVFARCDAIGEGNWRYYIHALNASRSDTVEVWKTPTEAVDDRS